jgi:hypothetical protein
MLKSVTYVLSAALAGVIMMAQPSFAAPQRGTQTLADCAKSNNKAEAFQIKGEINGFSSLRMGPVVETVSLVDISGDTFQGSTTLTKAGPYQYVLYGIYIGKPAQGELVAPTTVFYGTSAGSKMYVQENDSGKTITTYVCDLNLNMLATP